jgi:hypothetical protein
VSFRKFQIISPQDIGCPEDGHVYLGRDNVGFWEKYSNCEWVYIITGSTTGSGTSGTSGSPGSSGLNGEFLGSSGSSGEPGLVGSSGTSGSSGKSGTDGTVGTSGSSGLTGTSGTSGKTGTSGSSGSSGSTGTSGSSGKDGNFYGSSGSSGTSGVSGYGGSARKWTFSTSSYPTVDGTFYSSFYSPIGLNLLDYIKINQKDADGELVEDWINSWRDGILKIEQYGDASKFGIYSIISGITTNTKPGISWFLISGMTFYNSNGSLMNGQDYLISYVPIGKGTSGTSGTSIIGYGTTLNTGYTTTVNDYYIRISASGMTVFLHDATQSYQELIIKNISNGSILVSRQNSNTIDGVNTKTLTSLQCLYIKDGAVNSWDVISLS